MTALSQVVSGKADLANMQAGIYKAALGIIATIVISAAMVMRRMTPAA